MLFCTEKATDSDFIDVIQLLGPVDLQKLFYALDTKQRDIKIADRCSASPELEDLKAIQVFQKWRKDYGKKATRKLVLDALTRCDNVEAEEELAERWKNLGENEVQSVCSSQRRDVK